MVEDEVFVIHYGNGSMVVDCDDNLIVRPDASAQVLRDVDTNKPHYIATI